MKPDPQPTPDWVTLPAEPTEDMVAVGAKVIAGFRPYPTTRIAYRAMVAARPPVPDHAELIAAAREVVAQVYTARPFMRAMDRLRLAVDALPDSGDTH